MGDGWMMEQKRPEPFLTGLSIGGGVYGVRPVDGATCSEEDNEVTAAEEASAASPGPDRSETRGDRSRLWKPKWFTGDGIISG